MNLHKIILLAACLLVFQSNFKPQTNEKSDAEKSAKYMSAAIRPCQNQKPKASERRKLNQILHAARSRTSALVARDATRLRRLLAPEFVYTNASGKVFDRESYIQNYALDESVSWSSQTLSDVCVVFSFDVAVLTATTHDVARFGDYRLDARFRTTQIYKRSAKGWIYLAGHTSGIE